MNVFPHGLKALCDVGILTRFDEGNPPIVHVATEEFDAPAAIADDEIVGHALVVIQKIFANPVAAMAQAKDEFVVPEMRVVLH